MRGKYEKPRKPWHKKFLIAAAIVSSVLLIALAAVYFIVDSYLNQVSSLENPNNPDAHETVFSEGDTIETDPAIEQAETLFQGKNVVNILLVGQDKRAGQNVQRTDAMILCTLNKESKKLTMTSFIRDLWVYIPGYYNQRINLPYQLGGAQLLKETLNYNFGVNVDYVVEIDFYAFMDAIDLIGGVELELTAKEAEYLNRRGNWDIEENCNWSLVEGVNLMTGSQALAYSRIRKIDSDFQRTNRQRKVLTALLDKATTLNITEMFGFAKVIIPNLSTDMTKSQMFGLILDIVSMLDDMELVSQRIPKNGQFSYANKNGASVVVMDEKQLEKNKKLLADAMAGE